MLFSHSDQKAQPWGGLKADFSEAFRPTGNGTSVKFPVSWSAPTLLSFSCPARQEIRATWRQLLPGYAVTAPYRFRCGN